MTPAVIAHSLTKKYHHADKPALNGFNLRVDKGDFLGLLGPNGAGKTTTISLFTGLLRPDSGRVEIFGRNMGRNKQRVKYDFGLVPQNIALYDDLTAYENLLFFGGIFGLKKKILNRRIDECLGFTALVDKADRLVSTFSGGMKRRLNLAAGLLHQPAILFLDEPTVGVDAHSRELIFNRLKKLNSEGVTIIYTTHNMEEAETLCNRTTIIDEGKVIADGSPADLVKNAGCHTLNELFFSLTGRQLRDK